MSMRIRLALMVLLSVAMFVTAAGAGAVYAESDAGTRLYHVVVTNLTTGQPVTPPVLVTHHRLAHVFEVGQPASFGVKEVAENGNVPALVDELNNNPRVSSVAVAVAGDPPPLLPGQSVSAEIEGAPDAKFFSYISMLICTNDGFTGLDAVRLPKHIGDTTTFFTDSYDAGTERNTEDFADLVPPCPALTGVDTDKEGSGTSNPALAEGGVIAHHAGIQGHADLQPAIHGWTDPVVKVEITRIR
ncbi:MAG: spondin domain-containing protein [Caldilineaceae bacterium]|nr:spondin domain-containing protein [Caldilineaceae bacterium]